MQVLSVHQNAGKFERRFKVSVSANTLGRITRNKRR